MLIFKTSAATALMHYALTHCALALATGALALAAPAASARTAQSEASPPSAQPTPSAQPAPTPQSTLPAPAAAPATPGTPAAARQPVQPGMAVVRDPVSGQLRPASADELRAMQGSAGRPSPSSPPLLARPPSVRADGVRSATLGERGMVYSVITRGADGKLTEQCLEGEAAASHALQRGATPSRTKEHNHD